MSEPVVPAGIPTLGESAHDKAMIAKIDGPAPEAPAAVKPEGVPDKFWDAAKGAVRFTEWQKSTAELEKALTQAKAVQPVPPKEPAKDANGQPIVPPLDDAAKAAAEAAKAAGADTTKVDFTSLSAEFSEKGELSPEAYTKLESAGLSKSLVDTFIAGQVALAAASVGEAHALAGGQETYTTMLDWASKNLSAAEQAAFDSSVTKDAATRKQAIVALKSQYVAAVGSNPALVQASGGGDSAGGSYQSRAEVTTDMRDPRYQSDPAFRAQVERKLGNSTVF